MQVDINKLKTPDDVEREKIVLDIIKNSENDPPYISDLLVDHEAAEPLLSEMRKDPRRRHVIQVIRNERGEKPKAGDIAVRVVREPLSRGGKLIPSRELSSMRARGTYKDHFERNSVKYTLDENGCFMCTAGDAEWFLRTRGVHGKTNFALTAMPLKTAEDVVWRDGTKSPVWYHLYRELTQEQYAALKNADSVQTQAQASENGRRRAS